MKLIELNSFKKLKKLTYIKTEVEEILLHLNNFKHIFQKYLKYSLVRELVNDIKVKESLYNKVIIELNKNIKKMSSDENR